MDHVDQPRRPVVIVDAFADEREMYEELLRGGGYDVIACEKLEDTLRYVQTAAVAVVITRIVQGPGVEWNGVELTRQLKASERTKHIPVIVMTTRVEPRWRAEAEQAGCDSFLMLPCAPEIFLAEVRRVTSAQRAPNHDWRLVWRLLTPAGRQLTCQMRRESDKFELLIADDSDQELSRTSFDELAPLHERASALRAALEAHGYEQFGYSRPTSQRMGIPSEGRAAFCGLIECAELFSLDKRDVASGLRHAATMGLVALGLQDVQMTKDAITLSRQALSRALGRRAGDEALLTSCEALIEKVEASVA